MKRHTHILRSLALATATLAAAFSCTTVVDLPVPSPGKVKVDFQIRTPNPPTVGTRAIDADCQVRSLDLLAFHEQNGSLIYQYRVAATLVSQEENSEATFQALLGVTDRRVKLLAIANCPAGKLTAVDALTGTVGEAQVRQALTGNMADADPASGEFVMTGDVELTDGIPATLGSIAISMMRSVAKVTIEKASAVDNFDIRSITLYRSADLAQYFPDTGAIVPPEGEANSFPRVNVASVPAAAGYTQPQLVTFDNGFDGTFTTFLNENDSNDQVSSETCFVVGGWFDGDQAKMTYYRMDFDTDDNAPVFNPMGQVLRNYVYRFTIESVAGPGWDTPDAAANHPATHLDAVVVAWNGGRDSEYRPGDRYVVMSKGSLNLEAVADHTDALYITTSGLPFTITSERDPSAGPLDTAVPTRPLTTDLVSFTLTAVDGALAGQQRWQLTATALTNDMIGDDLFLDALNGLINIRIPVRRTGDFSVDRIGDLESVPVGGTREVDGNLTNYVEYEIHIPDNLTWNATITDYGWSSDNNTNTTHRGYLLDGEGHPAASLDGQPGTATLRVGFDRLYYPILKASPRVTIEIAVTDHSDMTQTITVAQDALPSMTGSLNVIDMYSASYGSVSTASYLTRYTEYLKSIRLFGITGVVRTTGAVSITSTGTGTAAIPASIDPSYRYVHIGGNPTNSYTQQRHDVINNYWRQWGNDRIFVYAIEQRTDGVFANAATAATRRTTVLSELGVNYRQPSGTGYVAKITTDPAERNTAVMRYLTQDGPFGSTPTFADFVYYNDGTSSGVDRQSLPPTAVPIIYDSRGVTGGCVMLFFDPANGVVYWGDGQFFDVGSPAYRTVTQLADQLNSPSRDGYSSFLGNVLAYIVNCAQYGSSFADLFIADSSGNYPLYEAAFP